jgi:hypothetical protein
LVAGDDLGGASSCGLGQINGDCQQARGQKSGGQSELWESRKFLSQQGWGRPNSHTPGHPIEAKHGLLTPCAFILSALLIAAINFLGPIKDGDGVPQGEILQNDIE